jgi:hypothetical protein
MERIGEAVSDELSRIRRAVHPTEGEEEMTVAPQTDSETEIVTGVVQGIVAKGDSKWQVEVNVGQQNPRRLWTKDEGVVQAMMGMIGQTLSFQCGKSHWTNNSGQPVTSLWVNGYGAPNASATAPTIPQPQFQQQQPVPQQPMPQPVPQQPLPQPVPQQAQSSTEDKIHRQTATKVAVHLLKHLTPEQQSFDNLIKISERLVHYYENGVVAQAPMQADGAPPHTDDDIPF